MSEAYLLGMEHCDMGYSIHYNPFRYKGNADEYVEWENGWKEKASRCPGIAELKISIIPGGGGGRQS